MDFLVDKMPALHEAIRSIRTSLHSQTPTSVKEVLEVVARRAAEVLDARGALVRIVNLETHVLQYRAAYGLGERYICKGPATNPELIAELCQHNAVVVIDDVITDARVQCPQEAWDEGIRMMLDVPLIIQSPMVGLLRLHFAETRTVGRVEKNFMISIAEQCASAIDKAWVIETQQHEYDHLALQTEKLSALGRMAAGIAHEINNPLAGIMLYSSRLSKKVPRDGPVFEGLQVIVEETARCRGIIQNLLEFSRNREPRKAWTDIVGVLEQALKVVDNELRLHHIQLESELPASLPEVHIDANQLEQVFINLLLNAAQAIEEEGIISVDARVDSDARRLLIDISDTGGGICEEDMAKIFEPFYSTKTKGTGLGLSVSYGIIHSHQGKISVASHPGHGARFTVSLPLRAAEPVVQGVDEGTGTL